LQISCLVKVFLDQTMITNKKWIVFNNLQRKITLGKVKWKWSSDDKAWTTFKEGCLVQLAAWNCKDILYFIVF